MVSRREGIHNPGGGQQGAAPRPRGAGPPGALSAARQLAGLLARRRPLPRRKGLPHTTPLAHPCLHASCTLFIRLPSSRGLAGAPAARAGPSTNRPCALPPRCAWRPPPAAPAGPWSASPLPACHGLPPCRHPCHAPSLCSPSVAATCTAAPSAAPSHVISCEPKHPQSGRCQQAEAAQGWARPPSASWRGIASQLAIRWPAVAARLRRAAAGRAKLGQSAARPLGSRLPPLAACCPQRQQHGTSVCPVPLPAQHQGGQRPGLTVPTGPAAPPALVPRASPARTSCAASGSPTSSAGRRRRRRRQAPPAVPGSAGAGGAREQSAASAPAAPVQQLTARQHVLNSSCPSAAAHCTPALAEQQLPQCCSPLHASTC